MADGDDVSELGNQFLEKYSNYDVFIGIFLNSGSILYRSKKIDCSKEFAVPMGGGGHKYASGNKLYDKDLQEITDMVLQKLLQPSGPNDPNARNIGFFDYLVGHA